ncbi:MAG: FtsL-like putative cell division protein [Sphingobacteriaceae bacterium]
MTNRLRVDIEEEETEKELIVEEKTYREIPENFFTLFFTKGVVSKEAVTNMLPFMFYIAFLGMIYIANRHQAEKTVRAIDKVSKEVKELTWDYKSTKAEFAFKSTLTEVSKKVDTLGIKESVEPPQKITFVADEH